MTEESLKLPDLTRVEVLSLKPDDVIICTVSGRPSDAAMEHLKKLLSDFKEESGIKNRILVVEEDLKFQIVRKADAELIT